MAVDVDLFILFRSGQYSFDVRHFPKIPSRFMHHPLAVSQYHKLQVDKENHSVGGE